MKKYFGIFLMFSGVGLNTALAQLTVSQAAPLYSPVPNLIQNVLIGTGVQVSNIVSVGNPGIGFFNGINSNLGLDSGVVMATGGVNHVVPNGPVNPVGNAGGSDPDLQALLVSMGLPASSINNLVRITFNFVPMGDSIKFRYVFASQEYPGFTCSSFNDVFGFFVSGPGITGPFSNNSKNIALIPGTNIPVAINTVNSGVPSGGNPALCLAANPNFVAHSIYFVNNTASPQTVNMPGFTVPLTAETKVNCAQTYTIKMAISDVTDGALNSAVFLEGGSFKGIEPELITSNPFPNAPNDSTLIEGCNYGLMNFVSQFPASDTTFIFYNVGGTATNGTDYDTLDGKIRFDPGNTAKGLIIYPFADSIHEGVETVIITTADSGCFTAGVQRTFYIIDNDPIYVSKLPDTLFYCDLPFQYVLNAAPDSGGIPPYFIDWTYRGVTYPTNDTLWESETWAENDSVEVFIYDNCFAGHTFRKMIYLVKPDTCPVDTTTPPPPPPPPGPEEITIPNIFTPNGDGVNDFFIVLKLNTHPSAQIRIFNRWGDIVFESSNYQNCDDANPGACWNGRRNNTGDPVADGVYYYDLVVGQERYNGSITIMR
ncbi:MAG: choice-of-anchor L domain-containing protein [Thermaurantimonas sp.]